MLLQFSVGIHHSLLMLAHGGGGNTSTSQPCRVFGGRHKKVVSKGWPTSDCFFLLEEGLAHLILLRCYRCQLRHILAEGQHLEEKKRANETQKKRGGGPIKLVAG